MKPLAEELFEIVAGRHDKIGGILSKKVEGLELRGGCDLPTTQQIQEAYAAAHLHLNR